MRLFFNICIFIFCSTALAATSNAAYISDELTVPLRSGPSGGHRILHQGLPSGTKLDVLKVDDASGFSQIRTARGTEGWIRSQYVVTQPIAKLRLAQAIGKADRLQNELSNLKKQNSSLSKSSQDERVSNQQNQSQIKNLEAELADLKRISAGAIAQHAQNQKLTETNTRLQDELDDIAEERDRFEDNAQNQAIMIGAGLILLGLFAGVLIKSRPQRSAWN